MKLGLTALRAVVGAVFFAHGTQKLFGWFGGPGLDNLRASTRWACGPAAATR
jgi:putative oxidoreductase